MSESQERIDESSEAPLTKAEKLDLLQLYHQQNRPEDALSLMKEMYRAGDFSEQELQRGVSLLTKQRGFSAPAAEQFFAWVQETQLPKETPVEIIQLDLGDTERVQRLLESGGAKLVLNAFEHKMGRAQTLLGEEKDFDALQLISELEIAFPFLEQAKCSEPEKYIQDSVLLRYKTGLRIHFRHQLEGRFWTYKSDPEFQRYALRLLERLDDLGFLSDEYRRQYLELQDLVRREERRKQEEAKRAAEWAKNPSWWKRLLRFFGGDKMLLAVSTEVIEQIVRTISMK